MRRFLILFPLCLLAGEIEDVGIITDRDGLKIFKCHPGDVSLVEVSTVNSRNPRHSGSFSTTNDTMFLGDMTMIPTGTNIFRIRTLCAGSTSEVTAVRFVIRRPIPSPGVMKAERFPPMPPLPHGMAALMPLPGGSINSDYAENRQKR